MFINGLTQSFLVYSELTSEIQLSKCKCYRIYYFSPMFKWKENHPLFFQVIFDNFDSGKIVQFFPGKPFQYQIIAKLHYSASKYKG